MGAWVDQIHHRARLIHDQIESARRWAPRVSIDTEAAVAPYLALLEKLYSDELPYARVLDDSDIVIEAEGAATETYEPRVSALTHLLEQLRDESRRLAKVVAGIASNERVNNIDLLLSGLARGSLVIGLKIAPPLPDPRQGSFLSADEPVFQAIKVAIRSLAEIPHLITDQGVSDQINHTISDPAVRDAALVALQRLSPSGRGGISRIEIAEPGKEPGELTALDRRVLRHAIRHPRLNHPRNGTFTGVARELDLDARRFEIRQVKDVGSIRCVYSELREENARRWLGRHVKVSGEYETDASGTPRLIKAAKVALQRLPQTRRLGV